MTLLRLLRRVGRKPALADRLWPIASPLIDHRESSRLTVRHDFTVFESLEKACMVTVRIWVLPETVDQLEVGYHGAGKEKCEIDYARPRQPSTCPADIGELLWKSGAFAIGDEPSRPDDLEFFKVALIDDVPWHDGTVLCTFVRGTIPTAEGVAFRATSDTLFNVFPLDLRIGKMNLLGDSAAIATVECDTGDHDILQDDFIVADRLAVTVGAHELEYGLR